MPKADLVSRSFTESLSNYLKLVKNYLADFFRKGGEGVPPFSITEKLQKYFSLGWEEGTVGLIAPSCSSKLVPVVFLFLLVYYLRKQLSFSKSE